MFHNFSLVSRHMSHLTHHFASSFSPAGHFEKLVSLGSEIVSAAPRAEFNGTELRVYVQRRQSRQPSSRSSTGSSSSTGILATSAHASGLASPGLPEDVEAEGEEAESPICTRTTGVVCTKGKGAGPEAAKAAAKKAKEEAASRAKEAAKSLPKVGRKIAFKSALLGRAATQPEPIPNPLSTSTIAPPIHDLSSSKLKEREAGKSLRVITDRPLPRSLSPIPSAHSSDSSSSSSSNTSNSPTQLKAPSPPFATPSTSTGPDSTASSPTRPKLRIADRDLNLTLRPRDGASFAQAAAEAAANKQLERDEEPDVTDEEWARSEAGAVTPKGERGELSFSSTAPVPIPNVKPDSK